MPALRRPTVLATLAATAALVLAAGLLPGAGPGAAASAPRPAGWSTVAAEGGSFSVTGTRTARYGTGSGWVVRQVSGTVSCSTASFGADPAPGQAKQCQVRWSRTRWSATPAPTPTRTPTPSPTPTPTPTPTPVYPPGPAVPASAGPLDVSRPTTVVGTGTPAGCTQTALRAAVAAGGVVTFDCGAATTTIALTAPLVAPADRDTVIDGGHRVVLDGQGTTQILRAGRQDFRANDRFLAVQRLSMVRGRDVGTGFRPRDGQRTCAWGYQEGGGGAISARDVNVRVYGVTFEGNRGPQIGPDVAGGAIYSAGSKTLVVAHSTFRDNSASNGGAIGALHVESRVYSSVFEGNRATGVLANFGGAAGCPVFNHEEQGGAGGLGGAFYSDGFDPGDTFSGVRMSDNSSGDLGGAVFRSAYWGNIPGVARQTVRWEHTTLERNTSPVGGGGGAYVNNSRLVLRDVTFRDNDAGQGDGGGLKITGVTVDAADVAFTGNRSVWGGGVAHWQGGPDGTGSAVRSTFSGNTPQDAVGDWPR